MGKPEIIELTERQCEVLRRIVQRKANKVIAAELDISEARVRQHVRTIKDRLDVNSMAELVAHFNGSGPRPSVTNGGVERQAQDLLNQLGKKLEFLSRDRAAYRAELMAAVEEGDRLLAAASA